MSNKIIFDASAMIALFAKEKGIETIRLHLKNAAISSVNLAEVYKYCIDTQKLSEDDCKNLISLSGVKVIDFNHEQAFISARLYPKTKQYGLSLGDRACIALAMHTNSPILTCDQIWQKIKLDLKIIMAR